MSLVPNWFYEECLKMVKLPSLRDYQQEWLDTEKLKPKVVVISTPRRAGKTHISLAQILSQLGNKKKEKKCFVFR